jgi:lysyl-tRNA synthetase class 1
MAGKDLIDSVVQSSKIARVLGARPPEGFNYEMFLDEHGQKISKSKGNGLSLDQWLTYGPQESLAFYAYREPKKAKQLHLGVIPRAIDEYWQFRGNYAGQPVEQRLGNPVHHIHNGEPPAETLPVTFGLLLNLIGVMG